MKDFMTIKEIADFLEVNEITIRRIIKRILPNKLKNGVKTELTKDETDLIIREIDNPGTSTVDLVERKSDLENMFKSFMAMQIETNKMLLNMMTNNQPRQIMGTLEVTQDYYTLKGYMIKKGIKKTTVSELRVYGKMCSKLSRAKNIEIRKADDEQWGEINSYHVNILNEVFE